MTAEQKAENALRLFLKELGPSESVARFLRGYGNVRTRCAYAGQLVLYLRWLKVKGVTMSPDELIQDNLRAVFESAPTDVGSKRRHLDWLSEYANGYLIEQGYSESKRTLAVAAIRGLYAANDSALFGHWKQAQQTPETPAPPLRIEDVRKVLLHMNPRMRASLVVCLQSGLNINKVLETNWGFVINQVSPVRVDQVGRKHNRRPYCTFVGQDSIEALMSLGGRGFPSYPVVGRAFKEAAVSLARAGLLQNPDPRSYHPHALRHVFETQAGHAGLPWEIRAYFEGRTSGSQWIYQHRDEVHPDDLVAAYKRLEPYVSLIPDRVRARDEFEGKESEVRREVEAMRRDFEALKAELRGEQNARLPP